MRVIAAGSGTSHGSWLEIPWGGVVVLVVGERRWVLWSCGLSSPWWGGTKRANRMRSYKLLGLVGFRVYLYCLPADRHFDKSAFDVMMITRAATGADHDDADPCCARLLSHTRL